MSPINRPVPHCQSDRCGEERRFFFIILIYYLPYTVETFFIMTVIYVGWCVCFYFEVYLKYLFWGVGVVGFFNFYFGGGGGVIRFKAYSERHGRYNFRCNIDINSERPTL